MMMSATLGREVLGPGEPLYTFSALVEASEPRCQFFVLRKKRLCRMTVRAGRQYCGEHEPQPNIENEEKDKRVPCPNDPKHTCYESKLEKHLTKCNARKTEDPPYIEHNINAPVETEDCPRLPLRDVPEDTLIRVIEKVNKLYDEHIKDTISTYSPQEEHHIAVEDDIAQEGRAESSRRHLRQASRLMQLAEDEDLEDDDTCYVELGAGKGMLSYYIGQVWCLFKSRVLVVDRASLRHKRDNLIRARACALRLRADLRHLALQRVPAAAAARALVGLAKHLCGAATDYAIRCLTAEAVLHKTRGALLATCCHHRCERAAYVGNERLEKLGINGEELNVIFAIVSWATSGDGRSRELRRRPPLPPAAAAAPAAAPTDSRADYTFMRITESGAVSLSSPREAAEGEGADAGAGALTRAARAAVGRRAKALVDYGRVLYLREKGFSAKLCYYVPTTESLENVCIVAKKSVL